jgi:hypothetical protein
MAAIIFGPTWLDGHSFILGLPHHRCGKTCHRRPQGQFVGESGVVDRPQKSGCMIIEVILKKPAFPVH